MVGRTTLSLRIHCGLEISQAIVGTSGVLIRPLAGNLHVRLDSGAETSEFDALPAFHVAEAD